MGTMAVTMSFCSLVIVDVYIDSEYCDLFSSFNRLLSQMKGVAFGQMLCWPLIRFASRSRQILNAMWGPVSGWQLSTCFRVADTRHVHSHIYVSTLFLNFLFFEIISQSNRAKNLISFSHDPSLAAHTRTNRIIPWTSKCNLIVIWLVCQFGLVFSGIFL